MKNQCKAHSHCWCKVSLAFGLTAGLGVLIFGLLGMHCGYGLPMIVSMGTMYPGFEPTLVGSFIGAFWAFLHTFLFFVIAGCIYKGLSKCCNKCCCNKTTCGTSECSTSTSECSTQDHR